jgi:isocitrate dehydrogenase (NAD+)
VPETALQQLRELRVILKGPLVNPVGGGYPSPTGTIRRALDLWVSVRLARTFAGAPTKYPGIDLVLIRDTTEGLHNGVEQQLGPDAAMGVSYNTRATSARMAQFAFEYARTHGRQRVTLVHLASVKKLTDGLRLQEARRVAEQFADIEFDDMLTDHACMQLVRAPEAFDVVLSGHAEGGLIADLCAGLIGSVGLMPGAIYGDGLAMFEAAHGTAPRRAAQNVANPTASILAAAMLLNYVGEPQAGERVSRAVLDTIAAGEHVTYDLGGTASTSEMADDVIARLRQA